MVSSSPIGLSELLYSRELGCYYDLTNNMYAVHADLYEVMIMDLIIKSLLMLSVLKLN